MSFPTRFCRKHGNECTIKVSQTGDNVGRVYYACAGWNDDKMHNFCAWVDAPDRIKMFTVASYDETTPGKNGVVPDTALPTHPPPVQNYPQPMQVDTPNPYHNVLVGEMQPYHTVPGTEPLLTPTFIGDMELGMERIFEMDSTVARMDLSMQKLERACALLVKNVSQLTARVAKQDEERLEKKNRRMRKKKLTNFEKKKNIEFDDDQKGVFDDDDFTSPY